MDTELKQYLDDNFARIDARFGQIDARFGGMEARLVEKMRDMQTELLRGFAASLKARRSG